MATRYDCAVGYRTEEEANEAANKATKSYNEYHTALLGTNNLWYVTNLFDPNCTKTLNSMISVNLRNYGNKIKKGC